MIRFSFFFSQEARDLSSAWMRQKAEVSKVTLLKVNNFVAHGLEATGLHSVKHRQTNSITSIGCYGQASKEYTCEVFQQRLAIMHDYLLNKVYQCGCI